MEFQITPSDRNRENAENPFDHALQMSINVQDWVAFATLMFQQKSPEMETRVCILEADLYSLHTGNWRLDVDEVRNPKVECVRLSSENDSRADRSKRLSEHDAFVTFQGRRTLDVRQVLTSIYLQLAKERRLGFIRYSITQEQEVRLFFEGLFKEVQSNMETGVRRR